MSLKELNELNPDSLKEALKKCCGSSNWVDQLAASQPFSSEIQLFALAEKIWVEHCVETDWLEAFSHHPKIGDVKSLEKKFATTKNWAGQEQAGVQTAAKSVLEALALGNQAYEAKFGYIFIVCATGKSAVEMLDLLNARFGNKAATELQIAMQEQHKITNIRLKKLLTE